MSILPHYCHSFRTTVIPSEFLSSLIAPVPSHTWRARKLAGRAGHICKCYMIYTLELSWQMVAIFLIPSDNIAFLSLHILHTWQDMYPSCNPLRFQLNEDTLQGLCRSNAHRQYLWFLWFWEVRLGHIYKWFQWRPISWALKKKWELSQKS